MTADRPPTFESFIGTVPGLIYRSRLSPEPYFTQLGELGLAHSVGRLAERAPLPVEVDVLDEQLAQSVETALYFAIAGALTDVAKHADATSARVRVSVSDGFVTAEIADDGCGGAGRSGGSGLRGLADRLEAIGGTLELESPAGAGTVVRASVPVGPPVPTRS